MLPLKIKFLCILWWECNFSGSLCDLACHEILCCVIVADHEDTRWLWRARMVCGARWSPARKTRLSVELSTNLREMSPKFLKSCLSVMIFESACQVHVYLPCLAPDTVKLHEGSLPAPVVRLLRRFLSSQRHNVAQPSCRWSRHITAQPPLRPGFWRPADADSANRDTVHAMV